MLLKTILRRTSACRALAIASILALSGTANAANEKYVITDLGPVLSTSDSGKDINASGVAAYTRGTSVYLWQNGAGARLSDLSAGNGELAINNAGHLAGTDDLRAYIYRNGIKTDLGTLEPNKSADATDLNNSDVVVGYAHQDIRYRAFVWQNGVMTQLPGPAPTIPRDDTSRAHAINDAGTIAGVYGPASYTASAATWSGGTITLLDNLDGYAGGEGHDINASGQVVGFSQNGSNLLCATIWNGLVPTALGSLPGRQSTFAMGINEFGIVVGFASATNSGADGRAFIWQNNQMVDLSTLLATGSAPWVLNSATAINNAGQIVGYGSINGSPRSFLLTPVPEPGSLVMILAFSAALLRPSRRL